MRLDWSFAFTSNSLSCGLLTSYPLAFSSISPVSFNQNGFTILSTNIFCTDCKVVSPLSYGCTLCMCAPSEESPVLQLVYPYSNISILWWSTYMYYSYWVYVDNCTQQFTCIFVTSLDPRFPEQRMREKRESLVSNDTWLFRLKALCHAIRADCLLIEAARAHVVNEQ